MHKHTFIHPTHTCNTHSHTHTHAHTSLEALMNLDVIGTEAELKGGGAGRDSWIKSKGRPRDGKAGKLCFQSNKITIYA